MDKRLLHTYLDGQATPEEEKRVMDWTEESPDNLHDYLQERSLRNALWLHADLMHAPRTFTRKRTLNLWMLTTVAASIALLFVLLRPISSGKQAEQKWQSVWVPSGQRAQVILDDGTKVWLNSSSTLTYPSAFDAEQRIVKLDGEGFFDVEKGADRPFIVQTAKHRIQVKGTRFNVLAYKAYEHFETSLLSGSVQVGSIDGDKRAIVLLPNQKASETAEGLQVTPISNHDHFRWIEGLICLDDERFEDLMNKLSLYFDIRITILNPQLLDDRCTGKFRQSDGIDYALKVLQAKLKFTYQRNAELNEIIIK